MEEDSIAQGMYMCPHSLNCHHQLNLLQPGITGCLIIPLDYPLLLISLCVGA